VDPAINSEERGKNAVFKKKYQSFKALLASNALVREVMADMKEKVTNHSPFEQEYVNQNIATLVHEVKNSISNLNLISNNKYAAIHETLKDINAKIENSFQESSADKQLPLSLENILQIIIPLNSVNQEGQKFSLDSCETVHDIISFCQARARQEMFRLTEIPFKELNNPKKLVAGIPLQFHLIDLGGGIEGNPKYLYPEHISSFPLRAFLQGLIKMKWPEPPPVDVGGFFGMIGHTLTISEEEILQTGENSFAFISDEYMNCSIRLGYHFSSVEAYAGNNPEDNYIRIFFKGGGAVIERRMRRVRLITEILKSIGFRTIKVNEDVIDAIITHQDKSTMGKNLEVLGKLTVYTKQQDMAMYNDAITDFYIKEFLNQHLPVNDA
jgi:pyruvate,water dikinase